MIEDAYIICGKVGYHNLHKQNTYENFTFFNNIVYSNIHIIPFCEFLKVEVGE